MVTANYKDEHNHQIENRVITSEEAYWLTNARLALSDIEGSWELALWGNNLGDEVFYQETFFANNAGVSSRLVGAPRTYGFQFRKNF